MRLSYLDKKFEVRFVKGKYLNNGNLFIGLQNKVNDSDWEDFCDITENFKDSCDEQCGYLNFPDMNKEIYSFIRPFITDGGKVVQSNQFTYFYVKFSDELISSAIEI